MRIHSGCCGVLAMFAALALVISADAATIHVNDATGNDAWTGLCAVYFGGTCGPKKTIQAGLTAAAVGDTVQVANGTYAGSGNVNLDFAGKSITLRSAGGAANCTVDGGGTARGLLFDNGESSSAIVCGFTITNCDVQEGAAIRCEAGSGPTIRNCNIVGNNGNRGVGIYCTASSPSIIGCLIAGNISQNVGGGIYLISASNALISNCRILGNWAEDTGGGIASIGSSPTIRNCLLANNEASKVDGGAIVSNTGSPAIDGCTFAGNLAGFGGGGAVSCATSGTPVIRNSILYGDTAPEIKTSGGGAPSSVTYSNVQGGFAGTGNINAAPLFVDADGPDNNAGTWQDNDLHIAAGSPCINTGNPAYGPLPVESDIDGQRRVWAGRIDMGSDERSSFAFGDMNCSGGANGVDVGPFVLALTNAAGYASAFPSCSSLNGDTNGDGSLSTADIPGFVQILLNLGSAGC